MGLSFSQKHKTLAKVAAQYHTANIRSTLSCSPSRFSPFISPEESVESDDEDNLSREMRHRATIPWRSCGTYLSSAGLLLLLLLLLSQLLKHSLMVAIDYWLAHWTSKVITAKIEAASRNCSLVQVRDADNTGELHCLTVFVVPVYTLCKVGGGWCYAVTKVFQKV